MQVNKLTFISLLCGVILGFIISFKGCTPKPCKGDIIEHTIVEIKHDTTIVQVPVTKIKTKIDTIPKTVFLTNNDTIEAQNGYFRTFVYNRSFSDTSLKLSLVDTVSQNAIKGTKWDYQILRPTVTSTTTITPQNLARNKVFVGLGVGLSSSTFAINPKVVLLTKKDRLFELSHNLLATDQKNFEISAFLKIHL